MKNCRSIDRSSLCLSYFKGGIVSYQTVAKTTVLGVSPKLIDQYSVVSQEVAESMALNALNKFKSSVAVATTGNAGPTKGDSIAEIGTVWIAIATEEGVQSEQFIFGNHRERVVEKAVNKALELVFKEFNKN